MRIKALVGMLMALSDPYRMAMPGYVYQFPRDSFNHPEYRTEWWYYTGNLRAADGHRFGYELTFFRQAVDRPTQSGNGVWDVRDVWLAHLALSDLDGGKFHHTERLNRSGAGIAGADSSQSRVWNGNWEVRWEGGGEHLRAVAEDFQFDLTAVSAKPPVVHGVNGVSQKSEGAGHASHYYSETRLRTIGTIKIAGQTFQVEGASWMDHEFFSEQMGAGLVGWDWFSLQLEDGSEVMLYRLRRKDGTSEPMSSGTYVDARGKSTHLKLSDFSLVPGKVWKSGGTGGMYPIGWKIKVPSLGLDLSIDTRLEQQEMTGATKASPSYWEGAVEVSGSKRGVGYLEMTGYAGAVNFGG